MNNTPGAANPPSKIEEYLKDTNAILMQVNPLLGLVGVAVKGISALMKKNGMEKEAMDFDAEVARHEAARAGLKAALDEFYAKYPLPAPPIGPPTTAR